MQLSETSRLRHRKNLLFVNKRKQKNFVYFYQKFFASFFQKRCSLPFLQPIDFTFCRYEHNLRTRR